MQAPYPGALAPIFHAFPFAGRSVESLKPFETALLASARYDVIADDQTQAEGRQRVERCAAQLWKTHDVAGLKILSKLALRHGWLDAITVEFCDRELARAAQPSHEVAA